MREVEWGFRDGEWVYARTLIHTNKTIEKGKLDRYNALY